MADSFESDKSNATENVLGDLEPNGSSYQDMSRSKSSSVKAVSVKALDDADQQLNQSVKSETDDANARDSRDLTLTEHEHSFRC